MSIANPDTQKEEWQQEFNHTSNFVNPKKVIRAMAFNNTLGHDAKSSNHKVIAIGFITCTDYCNPCFSYA